VTTSATRSSTVDGSGRSRAPRVRVWWWIGAALAGVAVLVVAASWGGAVAQSRITGLPDAGQFTAWGLPLARMLSDLAGAGAVGCCVSAAFLLPGRDAMIGPAAYRLLRLAAWLGGGWAAASVALTVFTVSDVLGQPLSGITPTIVMSFATSVSQGQALAFQALLAITTAVVAGRALSRNGAAAAALLSLAAVLPPAFTGHAAGAGNHQLAVSSLAVHVLAASLWLGGLVALLVLKPHTLAAAVAFRYSRLALVCFVAVAVSGIVNAAIRLGTWSVLWHSSYGLLVLGKVAALLVLGGFGAVHRRWSLRRLAASSPGAFVQLAAGEGVVFAATFGLAVALSRTPTPVPTNPIEYDAFTDLVGFPMPPPMTLAHLLGQPLPDLFLLAVATAGIGAYLAGVWRLRRAGHPWPLARTASWTGGLLLFGALTNLGMARYAYLLFSVHMGQHMMLSMVVPGLLVAGAPVTLALRALRNPVDPQVRGPRQWLLLVLHSRVARLLTHPLVALAIYVTGLYALYFSSLFPTLMRSHLGHLAMVVHFVLSGYLLAWVLVGTDPGRHRWTPPMLILVLFAAMAFHAFFGVALMQAQYPVAGPWYSLVHPPWASSLADDQTLGAGIAWAFGEIPAALLMIVLFRQWMHADEREQRRLDRAADRADADGVDDDLAGYNAFLRQANAARAE
jgi:cytochrome c oxidase assembly factor CtaG/putative copper export protein